MHHPLAPCSIVRSPSPSRPGLPKTSPLTICKSTNFAPSPTASSGGSQGLPIYLNIQSRSHAPKPAIRLSIPEPNKRNNESTARPSANDSPLFGGYYGGPGGPSLELSSTGRAEEVHPAPEPRSTTVLPGSSYAVVGVRGSPNALNHAPLAWSDSVFDELSLLGEGTGGTVHKVRDKRTGKVMARKTIGTREVPVKQVLRELSIISSIHHNNIISFHGAYTSSSSSEVNILMEFCEGGSLESIAKHIKERGATFEENIVGRLAEGVLQALAYLQTKRITHRDVKPSNILISREGVVKLCDFGVSSELLSSLAGTPTGTSFYMAPERIRGHRYNIRSDVWSIGISLLELVQSQFPFPNDLTPIELMMYITTGGPPRLEDEPGMQWSADMKDFIRQTLTIAALMRPAPNDMLIHPWIINAMEQEVNMAGWISQVWGWHRLD